MAEQVRAVVAGVLFLSVLAVPAGLIGLPLLVLSFLLMLFANREIALFFYRRGGLLFACGALLFHQVYYLYSAASFAFVVLEHILLKHFSSKTPTS